MGYVINLYKLVEFAFQRENWTSEDVLVRVISISGVVQIRVKNRFAWNKSNVSFQAYEWNPLTEMDTTRRDSATVVSAVMTLVDISSQPEPISWRSLQLHEWSWLGWAKVSRKNITSTQKLENRFSKPQNSALLRAKKRAKTSPSGIYTDAPGTYQLDDGYQPTDQITFGKLQPGENISGETGIQTMIEDEREAGAPYRKIFDQGSLVLYHGRKDHSEKITVSEVGGTIGGMESSKPAGPSGVVADKMKAAGEVGMKWMTDVCNGVVKDGRIPEDWSKSWLVNVYKGEGEVLVCGSEKKNSIHEKNFLIRIFYNV